MQRAIIYFLLGTTISFLLNYFLISTENVGLDLYYAFAFGLSWGLAYYVDQPEWALSKKMGLSFLAMILLVILGILLFDVERAIPSILKFSIVFVAYYLLASFKESKSLRK